MKVSGGNSSQIPPRACRGLITVSDEIHVTVAWSEKELKYNLAYSSRPEVSGLPEV